MTFLSSFVCVHPHTDVCVRHAARPIKRCKREKQRNKNKNKKCEEDGAREILAAVAQRSPELRR